MKNENGRAPFIDGDGLWPHSRAQKQQAFWGIWRKPLILSLFVGFCRFLSVKKRIYES
jgi:hypothetical protein